jgi:hypothetical protein
MLSALILLALKLELASLTAPRKKTRTDRAEGQIEYRQRVTSIATARLSRCLRWQVPTLLLMRSSPRGSRPVVFNLSMDQ